MIKQLLRALVVGARFRQRRLGLGDACPRFGQFAVDRVAGDARQHVALAYAVADVGAHLGDAGHTAD